MSLGVYLESHCSHCGHTASEEVTNGITYNLVPMFREAGWDHEKYDQMTGSAMIPIATAALDLICSQPARFTKLNPKNGWGSYEDAVWFFKTLVEKCREYPDYRLRFCR